MINLTLDLMETKAKVATYGGAGTSAFSGLAAADTGLSPVAYTLADWGVLVGMVVAVLGLVTQVVFSVLRYRLERQKMRAGK